MVMKQNMTQSEMTRNGQKLFRTIDIILDMDKMPENKL